MFSKISHMSVISALVFMVFSSQSMASERVENWVGVIDDYEGFHSSIHNRKDHPLKFTRSSDGESFYITEGAEKLLGEHLELDKPLIVQVSGKITSQFLFFGGNMIIDSVKSMEPVPLAQIEHRKTRSTDTYGRPHGRLDR